MRVQPQRRPHRRLVLNDWEHNIDQARLLIGRLERISADSIWARRSSGARGGLLHWLETFDQAGEADQQQLSALLQAAYFYLENAARERLR
jgi:hypothetical protein